MLGHSTVFGIDSHARSSTICALDPLTGEITTKKFAGNDYGEIAKWMRAFPQPSYAVYESGCTGFFPARSLRELGVNVDVVATSRLPRSIHDDKAKTDRGDAVRLAKAILSHDTVPVYVPTPEAEALRNLSSALDDVAGKTKVTKQQIHALLLSHGHVWSEATPAGRPRRRWCCDHREWLSKIELGTPGAQEALESYLCALDDLESQYRQLEAGARRAADASRLKPVIDSLQLIKGSQFRLALAFASEIEDFSRFRNGRSVASYFGLVSRERSSGNRQIKGGITKTGHSITRRLAVEGSWSYARATCRVKPVPKGVEVVSEEVRRHANHGSERLRKRRAYLLEQGKHPCKANTATAAELVKWLWTIGLMVQEME